MNLICLCEPSSLQYSCTYKIIQSFWCHRAHGRTMKQPTELKDKAHSTSSVFGHSQAPGQSQQEVNGSQRQGSRWPLIFSHALPNLPSHWFKNTQIACWLHQIKQDHWQACIFIQSIPWVREVKSYQNQKSTWTSSSPRYQAEKQPLWQWVFVVGPTGLRNVWDWWKTPLYDSVWLGEFPGRIALWDHDWGERPMLNTAHIFPKAAQMNQSCAEVAHAECKLLSHPCEYMHGCSCVSIAELPGLFNCLILCLSSTQKATVGLPSPVL